jgi:hypothetical protein
MRDKILIVEKSAYKTTKRPLVKKIEKNRKADRERAADFGEKPIMFWWPYLWNPSLDHAVF